MIKVTTHKAPLEPLGYTIQIKVKRGESTFYFNITHREFDSLARQLDSLRTRDA